MERWPNFFIVGAQRAGTTSLYEYLKQTKGIFLPSHKEPHYFTKNVESNQLSKPITDKKKYLELFKNANDESVIGEASPTYLTDPKAPNLIYEVSPNAKIIIILRDPVERAYSFYLWRVSNGKNYSFSEAIKESLTCKNDYYASLITSGGWYYESVKRYLDLFGKKQVKILIFEEFIKNPKKYVKDVLEFLGVFSEPPQSVEIVHNILTEPKGKMSTFLMRNRISQTLNRKILPVEVGEFISKKVLGKKISKPPIPVKDQRYLKEIYKEDVKKLQALLGMNLPWNL